jgi:hypothetical protein
MTTARPYRAAVSVPAALEELRRCAGAQFDPRVTAAFEDVILSTGDADGGLVYGRPATAPAIRASGSVRVVPRASSRRSAVR